VELQQRRLELDEKKIKREFADRKEQREAELELNKLELQARMQEMELKKLELQLQTKKEYAAYLVYLVISRLSRHRSPACQSASHVFLVLLAELFAP
jgi:hypothetical protein